MKTIKGNLKLTKDTVFDESLKVEGSITGYFDLKVKGDISARNISARNISARNISARNISAWDISAGNITARNISAGDISAGDISAWDISAGNISAWDISARDISFYAVCFAYNNIKCKSIKGRREYSKYFALDGKVEVKS